MSGIDLQPTLVGDTVRLRPIVVDDFESLYAAASDPKVWAQHPDTERYKREGFKARYFDGAVECGAALIVECSKTAEILGCSRYYDSNVEAKEIAIGFTFLKCERWGDGTNSEVKALMLKHISRWVNAVWFHIGSDNIRSRRAVEKLGATLVQEKREESNGFEFIQVYYRLEC